MEIHIFFSKLPFQISHYLTSDFFEIFYTYLSRFVYFGPTTKRTKLVKIEKNVSLVWRRERKH